MDILPYQTAHEAGVQALFAIPVSGGIVLSLERQPDYLRGAHVQTERPEVYVCVARHSGEVVGVFNVGERRVWLHGEVVYAPYFCDLRIAPAHQNGSLLFRIIRFVGALGLDLDRRPALTVVFADNHRMVGLIQKRQRRPGSTVPYYHPFVEVQTHVFRRVPARLGRHTGVTVRPATPADIPAMMALQTEWVRGDYQPYYALEEVGHSPYYDGTGIGHYHLAWAGGQLLGFVGVYDPSGFKQTVVRAYANGLGLLRRPFNLVAGGLMGYPMLPPPGGRLHSLSLHTAVVAHRDPNVFGALVHHIAQARLAGTRHTGLMCTLDVRDPLAQTMRAISAKITKPGYVYLVTATEAPPPVSKPAWLNVDAVRI